MIIDKRDWRENNVKRCTACANRRPRACRENQTVYSFSFTSHIRALLHLFLILLKNQKPSAPLAASTWCQPGGIQSQKWMMHKTEKCIYHGHNTMSCCCKHRNGKIRRLRWWKYITKPERHLWMLLREHDRGHNRSLQGKSSIFLQRRGEFVMKSWGNRVKKKVTLHVCVPAHLRVHEFCLLLAEGKAQRARLPC